MDIAFGNWLAGFTDGEGCFTVRASIRKGTGRFEITPSFSIILRKDDTAILEEIRSRLGVKARIKFYDTMTNKQGVTSKPRVLLELRSRKQCLKLVEVFDQYPLRAKKLNDYLIWREILLTLEKTPRGNKWHGPRDNTAILALVQKLRGVRVYRED